VYPLAFAFRAVSSSSCHDFGGALHADVGEDLLVVAERPEAGDERDPVLGPVELAVLGEGGEEVRLDLRVQHVAGRVEQLLVGVGDPVVDVEDVRQPAGLDHRVDLLVDVVPVNRLGCF
jgi:hypothetical protein